MSPKKNHTLSGEERQATIHELFQERLRLNIRHTLITILEEEVNAFTQAALYQRTAERKDYRNGYYERDLVTTAGAIEDLAVPRTRNGFQTELFERYQRRQAELDEAILDMFVKGVSMVQVGNIVETLTGTQPSSSTVSRVFHTLEGEFEGWKTRSLKARYWYAYADGTYFTVIYDKTGCKMPILAVVGVDEEGRRDVLAFSVGERENQDAWEELMQNLKDRGVVSVDLWITDGNKATTNAIDLKFLASKRQRCTRHKMENVLGYIPEKQQGQVEPERKAIFYQKNRKKAEQEAAVFVAKYEKIYPTAVECLKRDLELCLTFYSFPEQHWKYIRTSNIIERLFGEVKKRSHKMADGFPLGVLRYKLITVISSPSTRISRVSLCWHPRCFPRTSKREPAGTQQQNCPARLASGECYSLCSG
jgi:putative transposase